MIRKVFIVAITLLAAALLPAKAQVRLEMSRITCEQWLNDDFINQNFARYWMSGYFSATRNMNVFDFSFHEKNMKKVVAYCKKHKAETLMSAIEKNAI